jgi:SAM-dependent methyltransferase
VIDWGDGRYELTAVTLEPVAELLAERLAPDAGDRVLDVACGTGNGALAIARRGATAHGVDAAPRLIDVAADRARDEDLADRASFAVGDATALPVGDAAFDAAISIFGVMFAPVAPAAAELRRAVRPGGRVLATVWLPEGPIAAVGGAIGRALGSAPAPQDGPRWAAPDSLGDALGALEVTVESFTFTAASPEAWLASHFDDHPPYRHAARVLDRERLERLREEALAILHDGNEDPVAFACTSRYLLLDARL